MLEHQAQVSHQLVELSQTLSQKNVPAHPTIFSVAHVSARHTRGVSAKVHITTEKPSRDKKIIRNISPDSGQLTQWAENSAGLYLAATIHYYVRWTICKQGNMKDLAKKFWVKLMALKKCINSRKYEGGLQAARKRTADLVHK